VPPSASDDEPGHTALTDPTPTPAASPRTTQQRVAIVVGWMRAALMVGWALIAVTALSVGQFSTSLADLEASVASGRVQEVTSAGGLGSGETGWSVQEVIWRQDGLWRRTEVRVVSPGTQAPTSDLPVVVRDVVPQLRQLSPDLVVRSGTWPQVSSSLWGVQMPPWVGLTWLAMALTTLLLMVSGPVPWRATRWAWFWVGWLPGGQLAFLVLSGPAPLVPRPRSRSWRLTGGWAFLALILLKALI